MKPKPEIDQVFGRLTVKSVISRRDKRKGNVRWALPKEQAKNRRSSVFLEFSGKVQSITAWARELDLGTSTLWQRLHNGWSTEEALTKPLGERRKSPT